MGEGDAVGEKQRAIRARETERETKSDAVEGKNGKREYFVAL